MADEAKGIIKNAPYRCSWVFRRYDGVIDTGIGIVGAGATISTNFGGAATIDGGRIQNVEGKYFYIDLTASEMAGDVIQVHVTVSSPAQSQFIKLLTEPALDSGVATGGGSTTISLPSTASSTSDIYNGASIQILRGTGKGQVRTIVDYAYPTVTVDRAWAATANPSSDSVYIIKEAGIPLNQDSSAMRAHANVMQINSDSTAAQNLEKLYEGAFVTSTATGTPSATSVAGTDADLSDDDDFYNDMLLVFTSGNCKGIPRKVVDYTGSTSTFLVEDFPATPSGGDTFILIALIA